MSIKAFSAITIKSFNDEAREIEGVATTPTLDRVKDSVKSTGLHFGAEVPLLLNHDHKQPVGNVQFGKPTAKGLPFRAKIAKVEEAGAVKDRTDEAWHSVKAGIIKGVSIGFKPEEYEPNKAGGMDFTKAEIHELSLVAIPCNPEAVITAFKSLSTADDGGAQAAAEAPGETAVETRAAIAPAIEATNGEGEAAPANDEARKALAARVLLLLS